MSDLTAVISDLVLENMVFEFGDYNMFAIRVVGDTGHVSVYTKKSPHRVYRSQEFTHLHELRAHFELICYAVILDAIPYHLSTQPRRT